MARLPLDPELSRIAIQADSEDVLADALILLAGISVQDARERPPEEESKARAAHALFDHPSSDFLSVLILWQEYHAFWRQNRGRVGMRRWCKDHYLSYRKFKEWRDVHHQLVETFKEEGFRLKKPTDAAGLRALTMQNDRYRAIHRSLASGMLANIAVKTGKRVFKMGKDREVHVFPGSVLFSNPPQWIVAAEVVETSKIYARRCAQIDPDWILDLSAHVHSVHHYDAAWSPREARVTASERISLFGLTLTEGRRVPLGPHSPELARDIFLRSALIEGDFDRSRVHATVPEIQQFRAALQEVAKLEDIHRTRSIYIGDDQVFEMLKERLPVVYSFPMLKRALKQQPNALRIDLEDLCTFIPSGSTLYPDSITLGDTALSVRYLFDPESDADGATLTAPLRELLRLRDEDMDWVIPGLLEERTTALLKLLPKNIRRRLQPIKETVTAFLDHPRPPQVSLVEALSVFLYTRRGIRTDRSDWHVDELPPHLKPKIAARVGKGKPVKVFGSLEKLRDHLGESRATVSTPKESEPVATWSWEQFPGTAQEAGLSGAGTPALWVQAEAVRVRLFPTPEEARESHRLGVAALLIRDLRHQLDALESDARLSKPERNACVYFGGPVQFKRAFFDNLWYFLAAEDIHAQKAYTARVEELRNLLPSMADRCFASAISVLNSYQAARDAIQRSRSKCADHPASMEVLDRIMRDLEDFIGEDFFATVPIERLDDIPRYLRGFERRAESVMADHRKDGDKYAEWLPVYERYQHERASVPDYASPAKRALIDQLRWDLEDFRLSVFAPEIRIRKISRKSIEKRFDSLAGLL